MAAENLEKFVRWYWDNVQGKPLASLTVAEVIEQFKTDTENEG